MFFLYQVNGTMLCLQYTGDYVRSQTGDVHLIGEQTCIWAGWILVFNLGIFALQDPVKPGCSAGD